MPLMRPHPIAPLCCLLVLLFPSPLSGAQDHPPLPPWQEDQAALTAGVEDLGYGGIPGPLAVFGESAFPVFQTAMDGRPACVVAAARWGQGRVVLFPHGALWGEAVLRDTGTGPLVRNAMRWLSKTDQPVIGVRGADALAEFLKAHGFEVRALGRDWQTQLDGLHVLINPGEDSEADRAVVTAFVKSGGGVLAAGLAWGWLQLNPGRRLVGDHGGNLLWREAGLAFADGYAGGANPWPAQPADPLLHARAALEALVAEAGGRRTLTEDERSLAGASVSRAATVLWNGDTHLYPALTAAAAEHRTDRLPSAATPLRAADGLARVLMVLDHQRARDAAPEGVTAHPAHVHFPGPVPEEAPRLTSTLTLDPAVPDWHSTGLYAPAGEVVRLTLPPDATALGLKVRVGAHQDVLWSKDRWSRAPEITLERPLDQEVVEVASPFGGLLYLVAPRGAPPGSVSVGLAGAVAAPHFVLGRTSLEDWRATIRHAPAPWAELETGKVVITVPAEHVRGLEDPVALMTWWDSVMDACADLAARPRERERPERYVTDVQISAGYMHAGYPIMTHLDAAPRFVDLTHLTTQGDWGMFHEMGHNHQHPDWTFGGTGEVTCNLFSLYVLDTCTTAERGHGATDPVARAEKKAAHLAAGAPFDRWQADPFLALQMYQELQEAFGWELFQQVFAEYRDLPRGERPRGDGDKRDQWMVRVSRRTGRDLGPFFESWGVPVSEEARAAVQDLPGWMPGG